MSPNLTAPLLTPQLLLERLAPILLGKATGWESPDRGAHKREHKIEEAVGRSLGALLRVADPEKIASTTRHRIDRHVYGAVRQIIEDLPQRRRAAVRTQLYFVELAV